MTFDDYFTSTVEYPRDVAENPLPFGTQYNYISSSFLDGFINYVTPVKAYVLARYVGWDEESWIEANNEDDEFNTRDATGKWEKFKPKSKDELFIRMTTKGAISSPHLDYDFQDDVLILSRAGKRSIPTIAGLYTSIWYFFWYDRDCSDCSIGRFSTTDSDEIVIKLFSEYVEKHPVNSLGLPRVIPMHYFDAGWRSG